MEQIIDNLLNDFERGKMSRRQLVQALAAGALAGTATPLLAAEPRKLNSTWRVSPDWIRVQSSGVLANGSPEEV